MTLSTRRDSGTVQVDQAIFTSVRSPMGEGYRIIAASCGLRGNERAEITRRSPSHDSLCESDPNAVALSSYPLPGGRYCVARSHYAGKEHTARGGYRVYTDNILLDRDSYIQFACNPVSVLYAMEMTSDDNPILKPMPALEPRTLSIAPWMNKTCRTVAGGTDPIDLILHISLALLRRQRLVVVRAREVFDLLDRIILSLPMANRRHLALTSGLKYTPTRESQLCFLSGDTEEAKRLISGQGLRILDAATPLPDAPSHFDPWRTLLERWFNQAREMEIERLNQEIMEDSSPRTLIRIANICLDIDRLPSADHGALMELTMKYKKFIANSQLEMKLLQRMMNDISDAERIIASSPQT